VTPATTPAATPAATEPHTVGFPHAVPPAEVDVLVVGAGPVGLAAAVELTALGVDVAVVDAAVEAPLARAGAMGHTPRVVEHFRRWGVLQQIRTGWTFPPEWNHEIRLVTSLAGHELVPVPRRGFAERRTTPFSLAEPIRRPQTVLQQVFLTRLGDRGTRVSGGWRVTDLRDVGAEVVTAVEDTATGARRRIRSRFVIGADGARSTVRTLAGIPRSGAYAREKHYRIVVRTPPDVSAHFGTAPSGTNIVFNQKASGFLAAISPTDWRVHTEAYPLDRQPTEEELVGFARAAFGVDLPLRVLSATRFHRSTRIADAFRSGRVLLAGDAAHVRAPGGNLGEGFGDVVNLGWKVAAVLRGHGGDALLDSYDRERRRHNARVADHALAAAQRSHATLAEIRRIGVPDDADASPDAAERRSRIGELIGRQRGQGPGVVFDERYDDSPVVHYDNGQAAHEAAPETAWHPDRYADDPRPGHRAPDGYLDPYGDTLYDRIGHDLTLLSFVRTGPGGDSPEVTALTAAAEHRGLPLTVARVTDPAARQAYHADHVLVRPDHSVAWHGDRLPAAADAVLDRVLGVEPSAAPTERATGTTQSMTTAAEP
jgi:2-polyprenyl-6-methoxyphenol hydroxylase-like FAD-dependent oxidoreductase